MWGWQCADFSCGQRSYSRLLKGTFYSRKLIPGSNFEMKVMKPPPRTKPLHYSQMDASASEHVSGGHRRLSALRLKAFSRNAILLIIAPIIICYHQMVFYHFHRLYLFGQPAKLTGFDLKGGLGYTLHDIGVYMSVNGLTVLIVQALIFLISVEKVGVWNPVVFPQMD